MGDVNILIWLAGISDGFTLCSILVGLALLCVAIYFFAMYADESKVRDLVHAILFVFACIICFFSAAIIPNEKSLYMMAGIKTAETLAKTEPAKEIGQDGLNIIHDITKIIHSYAVEKENKSRRNNEDY